MKVNLQDSFVEKLTRQLAYIAADKPQAARRFKKSLIARLKELSKFPYKCKKSIYFDDKQIRDLVFMGYTIVYKIDETQMTITVFGFVKQEEQFLQH